LRRWKELLADREMTRFEGRIETDRHGHVIMSPPPAPTHGGFQVEIARLMYSLFRTGRIMTECPISTADGVRAADVAWASPERMRDLGELVCFPIAPEICVEVLSPSNSEVEIKEKAALYFDAGAKEVWLCSASGQMTFLAAGQIHPLRASQLCSQFPNKIELR